MRQRRGGRIKMTAGDVHHGDSKSIPERLTEIGDDLR
jgi:hypothetical protein